MPWGHCPNVLRLFIVFGAFVHHWGEPCDLFLRHSFLPPSCKLEGRNLCFIRSLHTFAASLQEATFHWMSCVSLLIASIHTQYIRMSRCDVSFQTCFCDIKKFSLAMVHSSWLSWLDRRGTVRPKSLSSLPKTWRIGSYKWLQDVELRACGFSALASQMLLHFSKWC